MMTMTELASRWVEREGTEVSRQTRPEWLRSLVLAPGRLQGLSCWLVILSAADLFMTHALMRASPRFYESNPLAQFFFSRWNITGMVVYKFGLIGGVIVLAEIIERHRPGWGKFVLAVGCVGAAYAIGHGIWLLHGFANAPTESLD